MSIGPHRQAVIDRKLFALWSTDLRAALDGRYGAFRWGIDGSDKEPEPEFWDFVEEHGRDWLRVRDAAGEVEL